MPFPALRNQIRTGVIVPLCLAFLVSLSGTALAKKKACPAAALSKARALMADGKLEKALTAYATWTTSAWTWPRTFSTSPRPRPS